MGVYARNGYQIEPTIDRSTGAMPGQHNRASGKSVQLHFWHEEYSTSHNDAITVLCTMTVHDLERDEIIKYQIVDGNSPDNYDSGEILIVSKASPIGVALLEKPAAGVCQIHSPNGVYAVEILRIE